MNISPTTLKHIKVVFRLFSLHRDTSRSLPPSSTLQLNASLLLSLSSSTAMAAKNTTRRQNSTPQTTETPHAPSEVASASAVEDTPAPPPPSNELSLKALEYKKRKGMVYNRADLVRTIESRKAAESMRNSAVVSNAALTTSLQAPVTQVRDDVAGMAAPPALGAFYEPAYLNAPFASASPPSNYYGPATPALFNTTATFGPVDYRRAVPVPPHSYEDRVLSHSEMMRSYAAMPLVASGSRHAPHLPHPPKDTLIWSEDTSIPSNYPVHVNSLPLPSSSSDVAVQYNQPQLQYRQQWGMSLVSTQPPNPPPPMQFTSNQHYDFTGQPFGNPNQQDGYHGQQYASGRGRNDHMGFSHPSNFLPSANVPRMPMLQPSMSMGGYNMQGPSAPIHSGPATASSWIPRSMQPPPPAMVAQRSTPGASSIALAMSVASASSSRKRARGDEVFEGALPYKRPHMSVDAYQMQEPTTSSFAPVDGPIDELEQAIQALPRDILASHSMSSEQGADWDKFLSGNF
ncbi:hypothetical protein PENSPDRAFT_394750 [Peniophora sp. CONT]|nr:hypothetical protein PENSPDRAFT_394750 [Peniophora sp. CONT]